MIAVIDYGVGNLFSLTASLRFLGAEVIVTNKKEDLERADQIILPGVGAFKDAIRKLQATGLVGTITKEAEAGKPFLGICLGMQLLFEQSQEYGTYQGLGLIEGEIASIQEDLPADSNLKVPHIGWNSLELKKEDPLFKYITQGEYVYYVHSFYGRFCEKNTIATSEYGINITGSVSKGNIYGTQFHPEKSGDTGLRILKAFLEL